MKPGLHIAPCSIDAARAAVMKWHYSKAMPSGRLIRWGAWEDGRFVGVVLFGRGATSQIGSPFGLKQTEVCELVRVALAPGHRAATSKVVAVSLRLTRKLCPGMRLVVSYADTAQGHHGGIYQASNWLYLGTGNAEAFIRVHGKLHHRRTLGSRYGVGGQSVGWLRSRVDPRAEAVLMPPKHKYVFPFDETLRAKLKPAARPYPKRGESIDDVPRHHLGEGGETPTSPLHSAAAEKVSAAEVAA